MKQIVSALRDTRREAEQALKSPDNYIRIRGAGSLSAVQYMEESILITAWDEHKVSDMLNLIREKRVQTDPWYELELILEKLSGQYIHEGVVSPGNVKAIRSFIGQTLTDLVREDRRQACAATEIAYIMRFLRGEKELENEVCQDNINKVRLFLDEKKLHVNFSMEEK